ncbi:MAG: PIN domain-containing protein [Prosthecobacter sp.]
MPDTNVLSEMMKPAPDPKVEEWLDRNEDDCGLSVLVIAEIADGIGALPRGKRKAELARKLDFLRQDFVEQTLDFDEACAWEWASYCNEARAAGFEPPVLDSMLAASARAWGLKIVTRNEADFPVMNVINPFQP